MYKSKLGRNGMLTIQYKSSETMPKFIAYLSAFILLVVFIKYLWRKRKLYECAFKLNGPFPWPIIGNSLWCLGNSEGKASTYALILLSFNQFTFVLQKS